MTQLGTLKPLNTWLTGSTSLSRLRLRPHTRQNAAPERAVPAGGSAAAVGAEAARPQCPRAGHRALHMRLQPRGGRSGGWASAAGSTSHGSLPPLRAAASDSTPPPVPSEGGDSDEQRQLVRWQAVMIGLMYVGYATFYLTRGGFAVTAPLIQADLGLSKMDIGAITSVFPIMYGCSKFASGVLCDVLGPAKIFAFGLLASSLINVAFAMQATLGGLAVLWALNGFFQGFGAPPCSKMITSWYAASVRGKMWSLWATSNNVGGFAVPLVAGGIATAMGWRYGLALPGLIGVAMSAVLLLGCRDSPASLGLPNPNADPAGPSKPAKQPGAEKVSARTILFKYVVPNRCIWALAVVYFFVYAVRQGVTSWLVFFLMQEKGVATAGEAARIFAALEVGGFAGGLAAGALSDLLDGHRIWVVLAYFAVLCAALMALMAAPAGSPVMLAAAVGAVGFGVYGPQNLIGLIGAEMSHPAAVATGNGVLGWISYMGAAAAGLPLSFVLTKYGWGPFFYSLMGCTALATLLLLPYFNARNVKDLSLFEDL